MGGASAKSIFDTGGRQKREESISHCLGSPVRKAALSATCGSRGLFSTYRVAQQSQRRVWASTRSGTFTGSTNIFMVSSKAFKHTHYASSKMSISVVWGENWR